MTFRYTFRVFKNTLNLKPEDIDAAEQLLREHSISPEVIAAVGRLRDTQASVQRSVKDAIFTNLFSRSRYLLELYRCLHPEDASASEADLRIITLENVMANGIRNDLGFSVRDKLFVLTEAQSTWSANIVVRLLGYLMDTWETWLHRTGQIVYRTRKVQLPKPELYVVFPGMEHQDKINLADEFLDGDRRFVDCTVNCIYDWPPSEILGQYIRCSQICDEEIRRWGRSTVKAAEEIRRRCVEEGILVDYMNELGGERIRMVEYRTEAELQELLIADSRAEGMAEGKAEGMAEGRAEGIEMTVRNLLESGLFSLEQIAEGAKISLGEVERIQASMS